jgi:signal transduction histidine kinase
MVRSGRLVRAAALLGLVAVYFVSARLGLSLALVHASASPVWPPTGIALAAFLLWGRPVWPAILAGAFLANLATAGNAATSLGIAIGNTLEGWAGAALVRRFAGGCTALERPQNVFRFVVLAGLCATAISPTIGIASLCLGGFARWSEFGRIWLTWWLGDAGGAVVLAPFLLLWVQRPWPGWTRAQWLEVVGILAVSVGLGAISFGGVIAPPGGDRSLSFLCLPAAIWTAFRFGRRETAAVVLILSGIAIWGTLRSTGALPERENEALVILQLFMGVVSVTSLSLAAVVSERRLALEGLARQAEELARSNADLDEFARVVSHDLKTPLRGIAALAAWIGEDCRDVLPLHSREHLALLADRARRLSRLIDGVLRYSRVGRISSACECVDSGEIVEEILDSLAPPPGVSVRIEGALPLVRFDRTQLGRVFQNLIQNGVQHIGRPSGEIVVCCREGPEDFEFSVRDDGVGIPESHLAGIFQIFHVVDPRGGTTGVGLSIVRKIVEMNGGSVAVESRRGAGTTFRFTIPKERR